MRTFLRVFIGFCLIIGLPILILVSSIVFQSINSKSYIKAADKSRIYNEVDILVEKAITEELQNFEFENPQENEVANNFLNSEAVQQDLKEIFKNTIHKIEITDFLRNIINGNLESSFKYINSTKKDFTIYIPTGNLIQNFIDSYEFMSGEIQELVNNFPICTDAQIENFSQISNNTTCIPKEARTELNNYIAGDFEDEYKQVLEEFESKTSKENLTVDEYYEVYGNSMENESNIDLYEIENSFSDARNAFSFFKVMMIITSIISILLVACYGTLKRGNIFIKIKSISKLWIIISTVMIIIFSVVYLGINTYFKDALADEFGQQADLTISSIRALTNVVINSINNITYPFGIIGALVFLLSIAIYLGLKAYLYQAQKLQNIRVI